MCLTGKCMILCILIYGIIVEHNNHNPLKIMYPGGLLQPKFGWSYYLVLFTGVFAIIIGTAIHIYIKYHPELNHNLLDERDVEFDEKEEQLFVTNIQ